MATHQGSCSCGNITVAFTSDRQADELTPRACDCDFCVERGAAWLSDPQGQLSITVNGRDQMTLVKQGSGTAEFWCCAVCGTVPCVTAKIDGVLYGAVNASRLADRSQHMAALPVSPKTLARDEKTTRWADVWVPAVIVSFKG